MKNHNVVILILGIVIAVLAIIFFSVPHNTSNTPKQEEEKKLVVAGTIFPLYDMVRNITQGVSEVVLVVPAGSSPHTFTASPSQIKELHDAQIIFAIGGVDDWTVDLTRSVPELEVVKVSGGISFLDFEHGHGHSDEVGGDDPHYWLSPSNAIIISKNIAEKMISIDPENKKVYEKNLEQYTLQLQKLDGDIQNLLDVLEDKKVIVMHESWNYFAHDYDIDIVGIFESTPGADPIPGDLIKITSAVEDGGARAIFNEPQLSSNALRAIASDLDIAIYTIDPLGGVPGRDSYIALMMYNANTISESLAQ